MESKVRVSIIIPVYNAEKTLKKTMDSVFNQTDPEFEIILVDDGSSDSSGTLCDGYSKSDSRVKVKHIENSGVSRARNEGIKVASGNYIMFLDADDVIEPNLLEDNYRIIKENAPDVIIFGFRYVLPDRIKNNEIDQTGIFLGDDKRFFDERLEVVVEREMMNAPWNKIIRRELILENGLQFDERFSILEDALFSVSVCAVAKTICVNSKIYHNYYIWDTGSLRTKWSDNRFEAIKELYNIEIKYCGKYKDHTSQMRCFDRSFCNAVFSYMQLISVNKDLSRSQKKAYLKEVCSDNTVRRTLLKNASGINFDRNKKIICLFVRMKMTTMIRWLYTLKNKTRRTENKNN